jgi:hypothetical protein
LGRIGGTPGQGCMGRPTQVSIKLTGDEIAALANIALALDVPIEEALRLIATEGIQKWCR